MDADLPWSLLCPAFDILPGLKAGDSYCAQGRRNAARESLRWVPAAGGMTAPLTSQANWVCPTLFAQLKRQLK